MKNKLPAGAEFRAGGGGDRFRANAPARNQCGPHYTVPPQRLLDLALWNSLRVLVRLPWEQHVAFLSDWNSRSLILPRSMFTWNHHVSAQDHELYLHA